MADGNAVTVQAVRLPSAVDMEAVEMDSIIYRAARDKDVPVEKLEKLYDLQKRVREDAARRAFDEAFPAMAAELPEIDKRGKIIIREKGSDKIIQSTPYALWEDTNRLIKPILSKHGFGLSFRISQTPDRITATAVLSHSGHREETSFSAPIDSTGSKNNVQGWGSSLAYCKRYAGTTILNLTTRGEDDDGNKAGAPEPISDEQAATLREWIEATQSDQAAFCTYYKIDTLTALPAAKYDAAVKTFEAKKKKQASK